MKKSVGYVLLAMLIFASSSVAFASDYTVVFIGGKGGIMENFSILKKTFPEAVYIIPEKNYPLYNAAEDVLRQLEERGINKDAKLILIGHSWGGLIARRIDTRNPGRVAGIITIGSPAKGTIPCPRFVQSLFFDPWDGESKTPLRVIGADLNGESDGIVPIKSALFNNEEREVRDSVVLKGEHTEILKSLELASQVSRWLAEIIKEAKEKALASVK